VRRVLTSIGAISAWAQNASGLEARADVNIETLLQWAYAQELVQAARPEGTPIELTEAGGGIGFRSSHENDELGTHVDSSRNYSFEAPADAYRIAGLVKSLTPLEMYLPKDCVGALHKFADVRGAVPDVEKASDVDRAGLIEYHASRCDRPDWIASPVIEMRRGPNLYGMVERQVGRRVTRERGVVMCCVSFHGDLPWDVARARLVYSTWLGALQTLRDGLKGRLERFLITDELPSVAPWRSAGP